MSKKNHINATVDFRNLGAGIYDLRIPVHQPTKALIVNLVETLKIPSADLSQYTIRAVNKGILLSDDDRFTDFPIADGDILEIL